MRINNSSIKNTLTTLISLAIIFISQRAYSQVQSFNGWNGIEWGVQQDSIPKLYNGDGAITEFNKPFGSDDWLRVFQIEYYPLLEEAFRVAILVDNQKEFVGVIIGHKENSISALTTHSELFQQLSDLLDMKYGSNLTDSETKNKMEINWVFGETQVSLTHSYLPSDDISQLSIIYRHKPNSDLDKL